MTIEEHLLTCLIEECGEIIQAAAKCLRFGKDDGYPGTSRSNINDLRNEILDVMAVIDLLKNELRGFDIRPYTSIEYSNKYHIETKQYQIIKYLLYAKEKGTVTDGRK